MSPGRASTACFVGALATSCAALADADQLMTQGPWRYMKRSLEPVTHLAWTPSVEDPEMLFVIACETGSIVTASLMHARDFHDDRFGTKFVRIGVRMDGGPSLEADAALVQESQLTIEPRQARGLVSAISRSNILHVSVPESGGKERDFRFRLQPNDLALRDIGLHCYRAKS